MIFLFKPNISKFISIIYLNLKYQIIFPLGSIIRSLKYFINWKICIPTKNWLQIAINNQLDKKIKAIRFDRGHEYYGRYDRSCEKHLVPFMRYLKECGIISWYTMQGTPSRNSVGDRKNGSLRRYGEEYDNSFFFTKVTMRRDHTDHSLYSQSST